MCVCIVEKNSATNDNDEAQEEEEAKKNYKERNQERINERKGKNAQKL